MQAAKTVASVSVGVLSGAGFLITAGLLHGTVLIVVQACIVTADVVLGSLGVYAVPNEIPTPPAPAVAPAVTIHATTATVAPSANATPAPTQQVPLQTPPGN